MPSVRSVLASLDGANRATRFDAVGNLGRIRRRKDTGAFYLDFRPYGRLYTNRGIPISDEKTALRLLEAIRSKVAEERSLVDVLCEYQPPDAKPNLVPERIQRWLKIKRQECAGGSLSPTYLRELDRYSKQGGYFSWWDSRSIHEIDYAALEDWDSWLSARVRSPKTRRNILGAFRSFVGWLVKREEIRRIPQFPWPKVPEHAPRVLSAETQDLVLAAIPERDRGIFLCLAYMGLRPGEARALNVADYRDGWLTIDKAVKGCEARALIRGTKSGKAKRLPVPEVLQQWIARQVDPKGRLTGAPLFPNPRTKRRWSHWGLGYRWKVASESVGLVGAKLYESTKHTMATDAVRRGVSERALQRFLGHADIRSTRRYAQMGEEALVHVLRPHQSLDLSLACPERVSAASNSLKNQENLASPAGFEPALPA